MCNDECVWRFNIGEWAEAYVFFRVLQIGRIYGMDEEFQRNENVYLDIVNAIRNEGPNIIRFQRQDLGCSSDCKVYCNDEYISVVTNSELFRLANYLYTILTNPPQENVVRVGNRRLYTAPEIQTALLDLGITSPKANLSEELKETYGKKTDIILTTRDSMDNAVISTGFSIKSHLSSSATLYNCSNTSSFVYQVVGCNEEMMYQINSQNDFLHFITAIKNNNLCLNYVQTKTPTLRENLQILDYMMDIVIANLLLLDCGYFDIALPHKDLTCFVEALTQLNPLNISQRRALQYYSAKIRDFLFASFAGMSASTEWNGRKLLSGGYIDVRPNGELLFCRAVSDDLFTSYLLNNTYIDRPSRGSRASAVRMLAQRYINGENIEQEKLNLPRGTHGDFGYIYKHNGEYFVDLNFQVRFR